MSKTLWSMAAAALVLGCASAQTTPDGPKDSSQDTKTVVLVKKLLAEAEVLGTQGGFMGTVVKNAPYSGEEITESTQTLADGTRIHNENHTMVYRDSEGRVRRETPDAITIWDPVANASYFLNPKDQTYRQMPLAVQFFAFSGVKGGDGAVAVRVGGAMAGGLNPGMVPAPPPLPGGPGATTQMIWHTGRPEQAESIGHQTIEGIMANGTRQVTNIETGAIGNDRPIQVTAERWYSPDLQTVMMTKRNDPRTGEETFRLVNVTRGDPPANLFALPAGYQKIEIK